MRPDGEMTHAGAVFQVSAIANVLLIMAKVDHEQGDFPLVMEWLGYRLDEAATVLQKTGASL